MTLEASGFLRYQIRRIIGAALHLACWSHYKVDEIKKALAGQVFDSAKVPTFSAAGKGLTLQKIIYSS